MGERSGERSGGPEHYSGPSPNDGGTWKIPSRAGFTGSTERQAITAAFYGDEDELTRLLRILDRHERQEFIGVLEYALNSARMVQRGSNRL
jgi:hypothetical protein